MFYMTKKTYGYWQFSMRAWYGIVLVLLLNPLSPSLLDLCCLSRMLCLHTQDWFAHKVHTMIDQLQQWQNMLDKEQLQEEEEASDGGVLSRRRSVQEEQVRNELAWLSAPMHTVPSH